MVFGGARNKQKHNPSGSGQQARGTTKKVPVSSVTFSSEKKKNKAKLSQPVISPEDTDSDTELTMSQTSTQKMLHKALK